MRAAAVVLMVLSGCWVGTPAVTPQLPAPATPTVTAAPHEDSYRSETIAADAIGVATMTAGLIALHDGANQNAGGALAVTGLVIAGFGDPVIHLAHGHGGRAAASYGIRAVTLTMAELAGVALERCREGELFCGMQGMLWGTAAGLAVAGVVDALVLHGQVTHTWTPTVMPTDGGARVGIALPL